MQIGLPLSQSACRALQLETFPLLPNLTYEVSDSYTRS